jgi:hypothetical protein
MIQRQQAGSGNGSNRSNYDLSPLFDKELQKQQQTNYETRSTAEQKDDPIKARSTGSAISARGAGRTPLRSNRNLRKTARR